METDQRPKRRMLLSGASSGISRRRLAVDPPGPPGCAAPCCSPDVCPSADPELELDALPPAG